MGEEDRPQELVKNLREPEVAHKPLPTEDSEKNEKNEKSSGENGGAEDA